MSGYGTSDEWEVRGRRAWSFALGVLDARPNPQLDGLVALAARLSGGPVAVWLEDGSKRRLAAGDEVEPDAPGATHRGLQLEGLQVGSVVMAADATGILDLLASEVEQALHDLRSALCRTPEGHPVGVLSIDEDLTIVWTSPELDELAGLDSLRGRAVLDLLHSGDADAAISAIGRGMGSDGHSAQVPVRVDLGRGPQDFTVSGDNRLHDPVVEAYSFTLTPTVESSSEYSVLADQMWVFNRLGTGSPIDQVLEGVAALLERHDPSAAVGIMLLDPDGERVRLAVGPSLPPALAAAVAEIPVAHDAPAGGSTMSRDVTMCTPDIRRDQAFTSLRPMLAELGIESVWSHPIRSVARDVNLGALDVWRTRPGPPTDADSRVLVAAARLAAIVLDHHEREEMLRHQATHDPLTGLPNRILFADRLREAAAEGDVGVLFVDLDRFKLVNDTLGHGFGDDLLCEVADRLAASVEEPSVVARFGGDEFTVLVPDPGSPADLVAVAERLLAGIAEPYRVRGTRIDMRASAGAALASPGGRDEPESLIRDADSALYHAKDRGRGRVELFDDYLLAAGSERVRVEAVLRGALENGRLDAHFQPAVRLSDGVVVGVEALARCWSSTGAPMSPATFIEVAEEVGLISEVFEVVLRRAVDQAAAWNVPGRPRLVVWVNVSPQQLGSRHFVDQVRNVFDEAAVDASLIGFEVTESGILPDPVDAAECLGKLAALGAHVAIDDFGTGYSSLGYLQALPVDTVKLDRSFVVRAGDDPRSRAIVRSVIDLTGAMELDCVAEGVETPEQLEVVSDLGCDIVQGYLFARPMPADELTRWLDDRP